jgi:hypothetical protein
VKRLISCSVVTLLLLASPVWGAYIYSAPSGQPVGTPWSLQPSKSGQQVMVYVSGGESVAGFTFDVSIGDGGVAVGGSDVGPRITNIDLKGAGMVFAGGDQSTPNIPGSDAMYANTTVTALSGTVPATGLLATLTIDTTGFNTPGQSWALAMDYNAPTPDTNFTLAGGSSVLYPTISNGELRIVPEPGTLVLLASLLAFLPAVAWQRKRLAA